MWRLESEINDSQKIAYWMGIVIVTLMGIAYGVSTLGLGALFPVAGSNIDPSPVFAFGASGGGMKAASAFAGTT